MLGFVDQPEGFRACGSRSRFSSAAVRSETSLAQGVGQTMPFESEQIENVFLVEWTDTPTVADVARLKNEVRMAQLKMGARLVFVAFIPAGKPMPDSRTRIEFVKLMPTAFKFCQTLDILVIGDEIETNLMRALGRTITTLARIGSDRSRLFFHVGLESLISRLRAEIGEESVLADVTRRSGRIVQRIRQNALKPPPSRRGEFHA
jgi:hypothetical protein